MLFLYTVLVVCCAVLLVAGILEQRRHFANLDHIPTRVLVNGIRGKSSITRLCAGALRGGGLTTVAKTTGTAARFIHPDATEEPVYRKFGIANVVEQIGIVRRAATYHPDALVIECMAVMPALQEINQSKLIRSTIGVLCNVREDHLAEMGPTLDDVARSLSRSMPEGGICVTAEKDRLHILQEEADRRDCRLIAVDPETVTDEELRGFSWFTFKENVAIALAVAELLGVDRGTALQGMYDAPPDPGVLSVERYRTPDGKRLRFANVFAANDPESTLMNINQLLDLGAIHRPLNVVINCRPDRVERNGQMGEIVPELAPETVFLIGHPTKSALDAIPAEWRTRVVDLGGDRRDPGALTAELLGRLGPDSSMVAIGNIHGQGELLLEHLAELPADDEPDDPRQDPGTPGPEQYAPHLDPFESYSEAYEARYQQPHHQYAEPDAPGPYDEREPYEQYHEPEQYTQHDGPEPYEQYDDSGRHDEYDRQQPADPRGPIDEPGHEPVHGPGHEPAGHEPVGHEPPAHEPPAHEPGDGPAEEPYPPHRREARLRALRQNLQHPDQWHSPGESR
ncbi:hypothetical protein GCM10010406_45590 [Streptomyces thermolineatus]|uniref:Capsule biosynthesis protein CapB n=1 Tax=Streptomyces thermolineatus TaxID=44033 RepID=A0ABP5ZT02_9ACTN